MTTENLKAELSAKSKYWIPRHRYYELKHFCLQYPTWKTEVDRFDGYLDHSSDSAKKATSVELSPVEACAEKREAFMSRMHLVEVAAKEADPVLYGYILVGVARGLSYDYLRATYNIPCGREMYYDLYRKFFWILDQYRG